MYVDFPAIVAARARLVGAVMETPTRESRPLSHICGATIFTKREYLQQTGAFKERGAANAMLLLSPESRQRGVIAASAGNHALALAFHGQRLGIPVTVVMPRQAPLIKQTRCALLGARVLLAGANVEEAKAHADEFVAKEGLTYIHGFDGADVIAGQGTIGLELLDQVPNLDAVVCPVGGAGLIAGVALAIKTVSPSVKIIGVQAAHAPGFVESLKQGKVVSVEVKPTLADGLAVPTVGPNAFAIAKDLVDDCVTVSEEEIAQAILRLVELEKGVVEGAGAVPLAAFLAGKLQHLEGKRVALILCGGNIDPAVLGRVIEYGLVVDGRIARFSAYISDRPGGLQVLASAIASTGANIKQVEHERAFSSADISRVQVLVTVETRDHAHIEELLEALRARGIEVGARS
jgi:threonine dehydratase